MLEKKQKKGHRRKGFPLGLSAPVGAPFLGEIAKPVIKKKKLVEEKENIDNERKNIVMTTCCS